MDVKIKTKGLDELLVKLRKFPDFVEEAGDRVLKQGARELAGECARLTRPAGLGDKPGKDGERMIASEVRRLFPAKGDGGRIYELIKAKDVVLANQYYAAFKRNNTNLMSRIIRKAGVARGIDEGVHRALRKKGGVRSSTLPIAVVTPGAQRGYIRRQQKMVGLAKGGWFVASKSLGGRSRVQTNSGKLVQKYPKYVRRHGRKGELGGSSFQGSGRKRSVRIWNNVRFSGAVFNSSDRSKALAQAKQRLKKAFEFELQYLIRKKSRR